MKASISATGMAIGSAFLFGASTPAAKALLGGIAPVLLAGLLYLGSGIGLGIFIFASILFELKNTERKKANFQEANLKQADLPWLIAAVSSGGILAPLLLLLGLISLGASQASLLLNLELVFTAFLAWCFFRENINFRVASGMSLITFGGLILCVGSQSSPSVHFSVSSLCIVGACLGWALDNNFTRKIANANPTHIAAIKGIVAGISNCIFALAAGNRLPATHLVLTVLLVGFLGYGISLSLFIRAMRDLGAARASAYLAIAPFVGASIAIAFLHESCSKQVLISGLLMALGLWLQMTEQHSHLHKHEPLEHEHTHVHDQHHQHEHDQSMTTREPHSHSHKHEAMLHSHSHFPDMHHEHRHN